jgi:2'-5' RNA ligase
VRLFVAVRPPAKALGHAAAAVAVVRASHDGPRWIPPERWHLTLAFYGEVPDADVDKVVGRLDRRLRDGADLQLALTGAGAFSRRAVWLGVTGDLAPLRALARVVARDRGRPYRPHLTVARLRGDTDPTAAVVALSAYAGPGWTAGAVHLVRSRLGPTPTYDDIASWPLTPRP